MYPLALSELLTVESRFTVHDKLENILRFGLYPDIYPRPESEKRKLLTELATDYLYRDVLELKTVKNPIVLQKLLQALALQLGSVVSLRELSNLLDVSVETVQRYINLLEQAFVIFRLPSFSRNLRSELNKAYKVYFFDLGIRNSLINNFNSIDQRNDIGALWENFCLVERMKFNAERNIGVNYFFWRTYTQAEIDLIEDRDGKLEPFEMKWNPKKKVNLPPTFTEKYQISNLNLINSANYFDQLT
jgi:predicted AAA+ superfamily ATPase